MRDADKVLIELLEAVTQAIGASSQLIHLTGQPIGFIALRDVLSEMKDGIMLIAPQNWSLIAPKTVIV